MEHPWTLHLNTGKATRGHCPRRPAARLWTCVWHPPLQRQLEEMQPHDRKEIPDLRGQSIVYHLLVWTADGWPHPAVKRTMQHAADIASCRKWATNVSESPPAQMETRNTNCHPLAKSSNDACSPPKHTSEKAMASGRTHKLSHQPLDSSTTTRWKEKVKIPTTRPTRLCPMMAITSSSYFLHLSTDLRHRYSKPVTVAHALSRGTKGLWMDQHALEFEDLFEEHSVSSHRVTSSVDGEHEVRTQHGFPQAPPTVPQVANRLRVPSFSASSRSHSHSQTELANFRFKSSTWRDAGPTL